MSACITAVVDAAGEVIWASAGHEWPADIAIEHAEEFGDIAYCRVVRITIDDILEREPVLGDVTIVDEPDDGTIRDDALLLAVHDLAMRYGRTPSEVLELLSAQESA
jgi:hypothetical protein